MDIANSSLVDAEPGGDLVLKQSTPPIPNGSNVLNGELGIGTLLANFKKPCVTCVSHIFTMRNPLKIVRIIIQAIAVLVVALAAIGLRTNESFSH